MHVIRVASLLAAVLLATGCASNPQAWMLTQAGVRYQLVQIEGRDYFLDQHSGRLYFVRADGDGQLHLDQLAGEIGRAR